MVKINRKEFVKLGVGAAVGATGLAVLGTRRASAGADVSAKIVHVNGVVSNPSPDIGSVLIDITVMGPESDLTGTGYDISLPESAAASLKGVCIFKQHGSIQHDILSLEGIVLMSNRVTPGTDADGGFLGDGFLGIPVITNVNLKTGATTWTFGPFVFTGTVTVSRQN